VCHYVISSHLTSLPPFCEVCYRVLHLLPRRLLLGFRGWWFISFHVRSLVFECLFTFFPLSHIYFVPRIWHTVSSLFTHSVVCLPPRPAVCSPHPIWLKIILTPILRLQLHTRRRFGDTCLIWSIQISTGNRYPRSLQSVTKSSRGWYFPHRSTMCCL